MRAADLNYVAHVQRRKQFAYGARTFGPAFIVTLKLTWFQNCGDLCALGFRKERVVVFENDGAMTVLGDGALESHVVS